MSSSQALFVPDSHRRISELKKFPLERLSTSRFGGGGDLISNFTIVLYISKESWWTAGNWGQEVKLHIRVFVGSLAVWRKKTEMRVVFGLIHLELYLPE